MRFLGTEPESHLGKCELEVAYMPPLSLPPELLLSLSPSADYFEIGQYPPDPFALIPVWLIQCGLRQCVQSGRHEPLMGCSRRPVHVPDRIGALSSRHHLREGQPVRLQPHLTTGYLR